MEMDTEPILAAMDAERLREEARSAPTLAVLLRQMVAAKPEDEGGACRHCGAWTGTAADEPHRDDCPWMVATKLLEGIDAR